MNTHLVIHSDFLSDAVVYDTEDTPSPISEMVFPFSVPEDTSFDEWLCRKEIEDRLRVASERVVPIMQAIMFPSFFTRYIPPLVNPSIYRRPQVAMMNNGLRPSIIPPLYLNSYVTHSHYSFPCGENSDLQFLSDGVAADSEIEVVPETLPWVMAEILQMEVADSEDEVVDEFVDGMVADSEIEVVTETLPSEMGEIRDGVVAVGKDGPMPPGDDNLRPIMEILFPALFTMVRSALFICGCICG